MEKYASKKKIKHLKIKSNVGAPKARNIGIKKCSGEWIQFLDADDLLLPNKITNQINIAINYFPSFIVASSFYQSLQGKNTIIEPNKDCFLGLLESNFGNTCSNLFNVNALKKINGWDENLKSSQEYDLMFRLVKKNCKYIIDNEKLTIVRQREFGQISTSNSKLKWNQYLSLRLQIIEYLKTNNSKYYLKNEQKIKQVLFDILRILAKYDLDNAFKVYSKELTKFKPKKSSNTTRRYIFLFSILGFELTEKILNIIKSKYDISYHTKF